MNHTFTPGTAFYDGFQCFLSGVLPLLLMYIPVSDVFSLWKNVAGINHFSEDCLFYALY